VGIIIVSLLLAGLGGRNLRAYLRGEDRIGNGCSERGLKLLADWVLSHGRDVDWLVIAGSFPGRLLWGNPSFAERVDAVVNAKITPVYNPSAATFRAWIGSAWETGRTLLILYPSLPSTVSTLFRRTLAGCPTSFWEEGCVPGGELRYVLIRKFPGIFPEVLSSENVALSVSSYWRASWVRSRVDFQNDLTDGDPTTDWKAFPSRSPFLSIDFGPGAERTLRVIAAQPGGDPPAPERFFRSARLWSSPDGVSWMTVVLLQDPVHFSSARWRFWVFPNDRSARFYRLFIEAGRLPGFVSIGDIAAYEDRRNFRQEFSRHDIILIPTVRVAPDRIWDRARDVIGRLAPDTCLAK
jgi:hypothetical protein